MTAAGPDFGAGFCDASGTVPSGAPGWATEWCATASELPSSDAAEGSPVTLVAGSVLGGSEGAPAGFFG